MSVSKCNEKAKDLLLKDSLIFKSIKTVDVQKDFMHFPLYMFLSFNFFFQMCCTYTQLKHRHENIERQKHDETTTCL